MTVDWVLIIFLTQNLSGLSLITHVLSRNNGLAIIMRTRFCWSNFDLSFWAFKVTCTSFSTELIVSTLLPASASLCEVIRSVGVIKSLSK